MRNFTNGFKVYNQLQKAKETGDKKYLSKCANAILSYREKDSTTNPFNIGMFLKLQNSNDFNGAYNLCNNWLLENDENYNGENWYGETYQ